MVIQRFPDAPNIEPANNLEDSAYEVLSDVATLTSEEDENDGTTVSLASFDGDTPDELSSVGGSENSFHDETTDDRNESSQHGAVQFGSTISSAESGVTVRLAAEGSSKNTSRRALRDEFTKLSTWWHRNEDILSPAGLLSVWSYLLDSLTNSLVKFKNLNPFKKLVLSSLSVLLGGILMGIFMRTSNPFSLQNSRDLSRDLRWEMEKQLVITDSLTEFPPAGTFLESTGYQQDAISIHSLIPDANELDEFQLKLLGCCNIVVTAPYRLRRWNGYPDTTISVEVARGFLYHRVLRLIEGVWAVVLRPEDAYGAIDVTIRIPSQPNFVQRRAISMGLPFFKLPCWRSFAQKSGRQISEDFLSARRQAESDVKNIIQAARDIKALMVQLHQVYSPTVYMQSQRLYSKAVTSVMSNVHSARGNVRKWANARRAANKHAFNQVSMMSQQLWHEFEGSRRHLQDCVYRMYSQSAFPAENLRKGMRSSVVKRARDQAIHILNHLKRFSTGAASFASQMNNDDEGKAMKSVSDKKDLVSLRENGYYRQWYASQSYRSTADDVDDCPSYIKP